MFIYDKGEKEIMSLHYIQKGGQIYGILWPQHYGFCYLVNKYQYIMTCYTHILVYITEMVYVEETR